MTSPNIIITTKRLQAASISTSGPPLPRKILTHLGTNSTSNNKPEITIDLIRFFMSGARSPPSFTRLTITLHRPGTPAYKPGESYLLFLSEDKFFPKNTIDWPALQDAFAPHGEIVIVRKSPLWLKASEIAKGIQHKGFEVLDMSDGDFTRFCSDLRDSGMSGGKEGRVLLRDCWTVEEVSRVGFELGFWSTGCQRFKAAV